MTRRARGVAMVDFIAGTIILAGSVTAWVTITRSQLESAASSYGRQQARNACGRALDDARAEGVEAFKDELARPDASGFSLVRRFAVPNLPSTSQEPAGRLEARPLRATGGSTAVPGPEAASGCFEVRAVVRWKNPYGQDQLELSTVLGPRKP